MIDVGLKEHTHEEADTQILLHVLGIVRRSSTIKVDVWFPDTNVLILLMDLVAHAEQRLHAVNLLTGKGTKYRTIDVLERVKAVGKEKSKGLIGLHNFSGAD